MRNDGIEPTKVPCIYCHRDVFDTDAIWDEGVPFHDQCKRIYHAGEDRKYSKKGRIGSLTVAEAKEAGENQELLLLARKPENRSDNVSKTLSKPSSNYLITRPEQRELLMSSALNNHFKRLEAARAERWGWEVFQLLENHATLELGNGTENIPSFTLENPEKFGIKMECQPIAVKSIPNTRTQRHNLDPIKMRPKIGGVQKTQKSYSGNVPFGVVTDTSDLEIVTDENNHRVCIKKK